MKYNIYAGLGGSFGGANYYVTEEFKTQSEAEEYAYQCAIEQYESYEGCHGLRSREEVREDYCDEYSIKEEELNNGDYSIIDDMYQQEVEGWLDYYVILASEDQNQDLKEN